LLRNKFNNILILTYTFHSVVRGTSRYVTLDVFLSPRHTKSDVHKHAAGKPDLRAGCVGRTGFPFFPLRHGAQEQTLVAAEKCHPAEATFLTNVIYWRLSHSLGRDFPPPALSFSPGTLHVRPVPDKMATQQHFMKVHTLAVIASHFTTH
jgi:hypothetical protein